MTISSPVGTVTTYTFNPDGTLQAFVLPFHDGPIRVTCVAGNGSRSGTGASGGGGGGGHNGLGGTAHNGAAGVVIVRYQM